MEVLINVKRCSVALILCPFRGLQRLKIGPTVVYCARLNLTATPPSCPPPFPCHVILQVRKLRRDIDSAFPGIMWLVSSRTGSTGLTHCLCSCNQMLACPPWPVGAPFTLQQILTLSCISLPACPSHFTPSIDDSTLTQGLTRGASRFQFSHLRTEPVMCSSLSPPKWRWEGGWGGRGEKEEEDREGTRRSLHTLSSS